MADQTCFLPAPKNDLGSAGPIKPADVGVTTLHWDSEKPLGFSYSPFMVLTEAFDATVSIKFRFIDCQSKTAVGNTFEIFLPDFDFAHVARPSLLPTTDQLAGGKTAGILFLNTAEWARPPDDKMSKAIWDALIAQASASNTAPPEQGKWPRSADLGRRLSSLRSQYFDLYVKAVRVLRLLPNSGVPQVDIEDFEIFLKQNAPVL